MAKKDRPILIRWNGINQRGQSMLKIAARRIVTKGCRLSKKVAVEMVAQREHENFRLGISFHEQGAQRPKWVFLDGEFDGNGLPAVTLTRRAMSEIIDESSTVFVNDLVAAALSRHCTLLIVMKQTDGRAVVQLNLQIDKEAFSTQCPHSELPNFLIPSPRLREAFSAEE